MKTSSLIQSFYRPAIALLLLAVHAAAEPIGPSLVYQQGPSVSDNTAVALTAGTWVGGSFIPALSTFTYNLNSITLNFSDGTEGNAVNIALFSNSGTNAQNSKPGTLLTTLDSGYYYDGSSYPSVAGAYTYAPHQYDPSLISLTPGTAYWVVATQEGDSNGIYNLNAAGTNTPSPGQAAYGTLTGGSFTSYDENGSPVLGDAANRYGNTSLQISVYANPVAFWQGDQGANGFGFWGQNTSGNTNFARSAAGTLDYGSLVNEVTDVNFSTTNAENKQTYLNEGNESNTTTIHNLIVNDAAGVSISHGYAAATLNTNYILVGTGATDTGKLSLTGSSLTVTSTNDIYVGQYGNGELNVSDGAKLIGIETTYNDGPYDYYRPDAYIGFNGTAQGKATVDGIGSSWTGVDYVYLGSDSSSAQGTLNITNGGSMEVISDVYAGYYGKGNIEVSGVQVGSNNSSIRSTLNIGGELILGYDYLNGDDKQRNIEPTGPVLSEGTLKVLDGGLVNVNDDVTIGYYGKGAVTVSGVNVRTYGCESYEEHSTLNIARDLYLGYDDSLSSGTLDIKDGGLVKVDGSITIGDSGKGVINVDGAGSRLDMTGLYDEGIWVGYNGPYGPTASDVTGQLNITNGGVVNAANIVQIGYEGTGAVKVDGVGSALTIQNLYRCGYNGELWVGYYNSGTLDVTNGGHVTANEIYIGSDNVYVGENETVTTLPAVATVDGQGSILRAVDNSFYLGYYYDYRDGAAGTLNLTNGGLAVVGTTTTNGIYENGYFTPNGGYCQDDQVIEYGTGTLYLGSGDGSLYSGTLNIGTNNGAAGFLQALKVDTDGGTGVINFNHNSSQGSPQWMGYDTNFGYNTLNAPPAPEEVSFTPYEFAPDITGDITVNQLGTGTTVLTGHSDYSGTTNIKAGTLFVGGYQRFDWLYNNYYDGSSPPVPPQEYTGTYFDAGRGSLTNVGDITVGTGTTDSKGNIIPAILAGNGSIDLTESGASIIVKNGGGISVASYDNYYSGPQPFSFEGYYADTFRLTTYGEGASIKLEAGSAIFMDIISFGESVGRPGDSLVLPGRDLTGDQTTADRILLNGVLDATQGGTLVLSNPNDLTGFRAGDKWLLFDLHPTPAQSEGALNNPGPEVESNPGVINGVKLADLKDPTGVATTNQLPVNETALHLNQAGVNADPNVYLKGFLDATTGVYELVDWTPQASAQQTGTQTQIQQDQSLISTISNALGDLNGRLYNLRAGGGQVTDNSVAALLDEGVIVGEGDGTENGPVARLVHRAYQWEVFTTVNYANISLNSIGNQAGVNSQTWSPSVGIERHLTPKVTIGFAASFINTHQTYAQGLGNLDINGLGLSTYASYVSGSLWVDGLYSFGVLDLNSNRNPGFAFPVADGETTAYTNSVQINGGWNFRFQNNTLVTGPFAGVDYMHASVDAYTETGGGLAALSYASRSFDSLITRLGWSVSKKFTTDFAVITPQFRLSYERQNITNNNATSATLVNLPFTATTQGQSPGQDYMVLGTGVNFQFTDRVNLLLSYQTQLFRQNMNAHFASVRIGYQF